MSFQPNSRAAARAISDIADLLSLRTDVCPDYSAALSIASEWHRLGFRADHDLPEWLAAGWVNPTVAHAAVTAGLTPQQAATAAELALADDYLTWWERDDNPHALHIAGGMGEAWEIYIDDKYPCLARHTRYAFHDRTIFAVRAACSGLLAVNFRAYASHPVHTRIP